MTFTEVALPTLPAEALVSSVSADGTAAVVTLRGEADLFTLPVVVDVLARVVADHDGPVIVDLAQVEFIDSGTMHALERASQFLVDHGRTLTLRSPSKAALRILVLLDLSHLIEPDRQATA